MRLFLFKKSQEMSLKHNIMLSSPCKFSSKVYKLGRRKGSKKMCSQLCSFTALLERKKKLLPSFQIISFHLCHQFTSMWPFVFIEDSTVITHPVTQTIGVQG